MHMHVYVREKNLTYVIQRHKYAIYACIFTRAYIVLKILRILHEYIYNYIMHIQPYVYRHAYIIYMQYASTARFAIIIVVIEEF